MRLDESLEELLRKVVREEVQALAGADDRLLNPEQVAEMLGYTDVHSVYRLNREGRLKALWPSQKAMRFRSSDVQRFIKDLAA